MSTSNASAAKGRDFMRAVFHRLPRKRNVEDIEAGEAPVRSEAPRAEPSRSNHRRVCGSSRQTQLQLRRILGQDVIKRFADELIDGIYVLYNEFKSVESRQRLVVKPTVQ